MPCSCSGIVCFCSKSRIGVFRFEGSVVPHSVFEVTSGPFSVDPISRFVVSVEYSPSPLSSYPDSTDESSTIPCSVVPCSVVPYTCIPITIIKSSVYPCSVVPSSIKPSSCIPGRLEFIR